MAAVTGNYKYSLQSGIKSVNEQLHNIIDEFPYINKNGIATTSNSVEKTQDHPKNIQEERLAAVAKWMKMKELQEKDRKG